MTTEDKFRVYHSAKKDIEDEFTKEVADELLFFAMAHNCMEVMTREVSKANGLNMLLHDYRRDFDIVGLMYGGDAENDKVAMTFVSKMAEGTVVQPKNKTKCQYNAAPIPFNRNPLCCSVTLGLLFYGPCM